MPTIKTETKPRETRTKQEAPKQEDLQIAFEIHTLAQILYSELATPYPWMTPGRAPSAFHTPSPQMSSMTLGGMAWPEWR